MRTQNSVVADVIDVGRKGVEVVQLVALKRALSWRHVFLAGHRWIVAYGRGQMYLVCGQYQNQAIGIETVPPLFLCCHHWLSPSLWSDRFPLQHATRSSRRHTWPKTRDRTSALLLQNLQAGGGSKFPGPSSQTRRHARKEISYDPSLWRVTNRPVSKSTRLTARKTAPIVDEIQIFSTRN